MEFERAVGRSIDELVTTEIRYPGRRNNLVKTLHDAARSEEGGPVSYAAGKSLVAEIEPGDAVIIATGAGKGKVNIPNGETDGPLGAVGIARAVALGLDARPIVVAEDHCIESTRAALRAGGLNVLPWEQHKERTNASTLQPYTKDQSVAAATATEILDEYEPAVAIAVEKGGPNRKGVYHSSSGADMTSGRAKVAPLFEQAADRDVLTVGIGDNGNEIGYGKIEQAVREAQPYGETCQCPCEGGAACTTATDHLVVTNASNWGAYGLEAMVAILTETESVMHTPEDERRMLEQNVVAGSNDGVSDRPVPMVDGTSEQTQLGIVAMLQNIVSHGFGSPPDRGF